MAIEVKNVFEPVKTTLVNADVLKPAFEKIEMKPEPKPEVRTGNKTWTKLKNQDPPKKQAAAPRQQPKAAMGKKVQDNVIGPEKENFVDKITAQADHVASMFEKPKSILNAEVLKPEFAKIEMKPEVKPEVQDPKISWSKLKNEETEKEKIQNAKPIKKLQKAVVKVVVIL